ncbi:hypothetical protein BC008_12850 [Mastigocoleus testarum BC008]|uniref:SWIM-type domain-containing protein n=2 Tax=Mastigocoleus TaxID=996924 RepID=A0A0V7ZF42_9CYAN|nr:hypothetical protein BC008_12745 [Mastigocoleus testarum BC008]KST63189.1 hypothetical protein BC008_12850 [Mastigocoleus testarum BC008]
MLNISSSSFDNRNELLTATQRSVKTVPFVELFNGRLQGVISSGSNLDRVYVSFFEAGTLNYYCSTNNNRPCGGLRGYPCKHLYQLLEEATYTYGVKEVAKYLKISGDISQINNAYDFPINSGIIKKESASNVFSRFLNYLHYLEIKSSSQPIPEMNWFV